MSFTIAQVKEHLIGMGHGGTLNKVRNQEAMFERAQNSMLLKVKPLETIRIAPLAQLIHSDIYNYPLASDFNSPISLIPQDNPTSLDNAARIGANEFDVNKLITNRKISIEGSEGMKYLRANWRSNTPKVVHRMDDINDNGLWSAVGTAANLVEDTTYKLSGAASLRFDVLASGDGLQNTTFSSLDLTAEDEEAEFFMWLFFGSVANLTSVTGIWGNDLTTKFWTSVPQTEQADGTVFRAGWNLIKFPWLSATETGAVNPATIDSFKFTLATTGAIQNVRADNIVVSRGRPFDMKYYSKYIFRTTAGVWESRPSSDDDSVMLDNDALNIFLYECLISMAHQMEGTDSAFDINFAIHELHDPDRGLYRKYKAEHPSESKKQVGNYGGKPRWQR